jgi:hypothetical protein
MAGSIADRPAPNQRSHADGRVELIDVARIEKSPLFNVDLAPVPIARRTWTTYNYAALWISMAHCIPTYNLASGLISVGMNWWQALLTILLGNTIVLAPILLNSHPGTKYGIPFPVFARAAYGTIGSNLPAILRALVACGWFGIQAWIGGEALETLFEAVLPGWKTLLGGGLFQGHTPSEWVSFLLFWGINVAIIYRGMDLLPESRELGRALRAAHDRRPSRLGGAEGARLRSAPGAARQVPHVLGIFPGLRPVADGDDRLLGDALPEHAGLHAVRPKPAGAGDRPGLRATRDDVGLRGDGRPHHERDRADLRAADLGSDAARAAVSGPGGHRDLDVHRGRRDARRQHRGQRRFPRQRFRKRLPEGDPLQDRGTHHRLLGIAMQPWKLLDDPSQYIFTWLVGYSAAWDRSRES